MEDCFLPFDSPLFSINKKFSLLLVQTVCKYILGKKGDLLVLVISQLLIQIPSFLSGLKKLNF